MEERSKSIEEYAELEKLFPVRMKEVKAILQDKYGIIVPDVCNEFIIRCLRVKDGNIEKAIKLIKSFHTVIPDLQNWNLVFDPSRYQAFYERGSIAQYPKRDRDGRLIFTIRTRLWDTQEMDFDDVIVALWMITIYTNIEYVDTQSRGYVSIWDFKGFNLQHTWAVKQWRIPYIAKMIQNGLVGRIKALHFVNHPRIVGVIYSGIKPFLKEKLKKRIIFHNNMESLYKHLEPEILPTYLGGTLKDEECVDRHFLKKFVGDVAYFNELATLGLPTK